MVVPTAIPLAELSAGQLARAETSGGRCRRLHLVEACRLKPGVHYSTFVAWGELLPPEVEFNMVCKHCLPPGPAWALSSQEPEDELVLSDGSSSSLGSSLAGALKRPRFEGEAPGTPSL